jgi:hypothetical protein
MLATATAASSSVLVEASAESADSPETPVRFAVESAPSLASVPGADMESVATGWDLNELMEQRARSSELSPSARSIAANLAAAAELEPELARFIEGQSPSLRLTSAREPLADVASPRDVRRNRLFAYLGEPANTAGSDEEITVVRERIASRLSEDQLYDQVRRIGGGADRLTLKF